MSATQLISTRELNENLRAESCSVVDCRFDLSDSTAGRRAYKEGHIPGAVYADLNKDLAAPVGAGTGRHPLPDVPSITATLGRLGISNSTAVVVYDEGIGAVAARLWWMLRWLGHDNVRLLDGGLAAWTASGYSLSAKRVVAIPAEFQSVARYEMVLKTSEINESGADAASLNLIDARDRARYAGELEPIDTVAGHIPGARNLPFAESMDENGRWKSVDELRKLWGHHLGDDRRTEWSVMCGSGVTACHLAISALEAGYREPRLYVGSWSEWITDSNRPIGLGFG